MSEISVDLNPVLRQIQSVGNSLNENMGVINANIAALQGELGLVDHKVGVLASVTDATKDRLEQLYIKFENFVEFNRRMETKKEAQLDLITVRGEIEKEFGHHDKVRRLAIGILQATDAGIVRKESVQFVTEMAALDDFSYWLGPALLALSSWLGDDRERAERAMRDAALKDDYKTSLFFALVCRRARRQEATSRWLARYFQTQNPAEMDREVVVMIDSVANGIFGGSALSACSTVMEQWLTELEEQAGFTDEQRKRWAAKLDVMAPQIPPGDYPTLRANSPTAPSLIASLSASRRNEAVTKFFETLFEGEIKPPRSLETSVDEVLTSLVKNFDDAELPKRKRERRNVLIIEAQGDDIRADKQLAAEFEVFKEKTSFAALLTNAAMNPEEFGATRATQRYAITRSREWIRSAHNDLVARDRGMVPQNVELKCGSWTGTSADGSNERELDADLGRHYAGRIEQAVNAVKVPPGAWIALVGGVLAGVTMIINGSILLGLILAASGGAYFFWKYRDLDRLRRNTRELLVKEQQQAANILRASLAELTDLRRAISKEDAKAADVDAFLDALREEQHVLKSPEQGRAIRS